MQALQAALYLQLSAWLMGPFTAGIGPSDGEGGGSEWLRQAFSVLELEDVELDMEQLDTLGKVGCEVQEEGERPAVATDGASAAADLEVLAVH